MFVKGWTLESGKATVIRRLTEIRGKSFFGTYESGCVNRKDVVDPKVNRTTSDLTPFV